MSQLDVCIHAGGILGQMPPSNSLHALRIAAAGSSNQAGASESHQNITVSSPLWTTREGDTTAGDGQKRVVQSLVQPVITHMAELPSNSRAQLNPSVAITPGLPARIVERIKAGEYIDFRELPPAKQLSKSIPSGLEG